MKRLSILTPTFAVCRLPPDAELPDWIWGGPLCAVTRSDEELSIVCNQTKVPGGVTAEHGWRAFKVEGPLDFSLVGLLAGLTAPLAQAGIPVFALSTFDTDYLLVKEERLEAAITELEKSGDWVIG